MARISAILACAAALLGAPAAPATIYMFSGTLSGASEVPATASLATGTILVQLDDVNNILSVNETFSGLLSDATGADLRCCAGPGATAAVAISFTPFPTAMSGIYSQTFDLTSSSSFNSAFITNNGGTVTGARNALITGLLGGQAYANIFDAPFPGGEIRGQLGPVPEPAAWAMMVAGFGTIGAAMRRRTKVVFA